jgi:hypothetical protein
MANEMEKIDELTETEALLKILELGKRQVAEGKVHPAEEVIERLRKKHGFGNSKSKHRGDTKSL